VSYLTDQLWDNSVWDIQWSNQPLVGYKLISRPPVSGSLNVERDLSELKSIEQGVGGLNVIADHFENCFSIYRQDFLKMIADHFSFAILLQLATSSQPPTADQPWDNSMWDSLRVQLETSALSAPNVVNQESLVGTVSPKSSQLSQLRVWTTVGQRSMLATKCLISNLGFVTALEQF